MNEDIQKFLNEIRVTFTPRSKNNREIIGVDALIGFAETQIKFFTPLQTSSICKTNLNWANQLLSALQNIKNQAMHPNSSIEAIGNVWNIFQGTGFINQIRPVRLKLFTKRIIARVAFDFP